MSSLLGRITCLLEKFTLHILEGKFEKIWRMDMKEIDKQLQLPKFGYIQTVVLITSCQEVETCTQENFPRCLARGIVQYERQFVE